VLVLDDEPDARSLISMILQHARAQVITAASVHEAMHVLRRERPDVIISDIAMPQRDGYDFIRQLRAMPPEQGGRIPAVALTAYARSEDRTAALLAGFQSHLAKPVNPTELIAVVANLAGRFPTHYNQPQ
jgi:CheY-like chemotaxis protein